MAAESGSLKKLAEYDYVQFVVPDISSIPRGKIARGKFKEKAAKEGTEIIRAVVLPGNSYKYADPAYDIIGRHLPNIVMRPCLDTLIPWPSEQSEGRRIGNVLCDVYHHDGTPDLIFPRQAMKAQLNALRDKHGLLFRSAFEYEFLVYKEGTSCVLGETGCSNSVRILEKNQGLFFELIEALEVIGIEVCAVSSEHFSGQWEITTEPHDGIRGGDVAFYVKNVVKRVMQLRGYDATFMAKPTSDKAYSGLHLNHSLWTLDGASAMLDKTDRNNMSKTARHWIAGLLTHAPALTALCCPTVNCYRRLFNIAAPGKTTWGLDNRNALIRVHTARDNVFLENRLPSGPCNPYIAAAATLAAGMDGLNRQLQCPEPGDLSGELPRTLTQALDALEKDVELRSLLGSHFLDCYVIVKRGCDVKRFEEAPLCGEENELEFEREMYMMDV